MAARFGKKVKSKIEHMGLIAQSRATQIEYVTTMTDAVILAAEQVQDKRLDLLETGPEITTSELLIDFMLELALGHAAKVAKRSLGAVLERALTTRQFVREVGGDQDSVVVDAVEKLSAALEAGNRGIGVEITSKDGKEALHKVANTMAGKTIDATQYAWATKKKLKSARTPVLDADDSAGVGLIDAALMFRARQISAINVIHDLMTIVIQYDTAKLKTGKLRQVLTIQEVGDRSLGELKELLRRFFEAVIWAKVLGAGQFTQDYQGDTEHPRAKSGLILYLIKRLHHPDSSGSSFLRHVARRNKIPLWREKDGKQIPILPTDVRRVASREMSDYLKVLEKKVSNKEAIDVLVYGVGR